MALAAVYDEVQAPVDGPRTTSRSIGSLLVSRSLYRCALQARLEALECCNRCINPAFLVYWFIRYSRCMAERIRKLPEFQDGLQQGKGLAQRQNPKSSSSCVDISARCCLSIEYNF